MKAYCVFKNKGEVEVNAFRLLGASSKETDDTKIGFWGSGLKYALAVLLRNNIKIAACSGAKEIKIGKRKTKMRDEIFDVITINGQPTSITTRAGKDWELWFAIRELYANGLDEEGFEMTVADKIEPEKGVTKIYVEMTGEVKEIFNNIKKYFSAGRSPFERFGKSKVFERISDSEFIVYRRGIRVWADDKEMLFDYDFYNIAINESRVIKSGFELDWTLAGVWKEFATVRMIERLLVGKSYEKNQLTWSHCPAYFNQNWLTVLKGKQIIPEDTAGYYKEEMTKAHTILPTVLCKELHKQFGSDLKIAGMTSGGKTYNTVKTTEEQLEHINKAVNFLKKLDVDVSKYPIEVVNMHDDTCFGMAEDGKILLSDDAFETNKLLASTLYEEYLHLEHGLEDNTRRMQTFLFKKIIELTAKL